MKCFLPSFKSRNKSTSFPCLDIGTGHFFVFSVFQTLDYQPVKCVFSTSGGYHDYIGGCSVHWGIS